MGRAYSCWMLNCWCITSPVGFKRVVDWIIGDFLGVLVQLSCSTLCNSRVICSHFELLSENSKQFPFLKCIQRRIVIKTTFRKMKLLLSSWVCLTDFLLPSVWEYLDLKEISQRLLLTPEDTNNASWKVVFGYYLASDKEQERSLLLNKIRHPQNPIELNSELYFKLGRCCLISCLFPCNICNHFQIYCIKR